MIGQMFLWPKSLDNPCEVHQVRIHGISLGRLKLGRCVRLVHFSLSKMAEYFVALSLANLSQNGTRMICDLLPAITSVHRISCSWRFSLFTFSFVLVAWRFSLFTFPIVLV
jgi:hypothetical protein